MLKSHCFALVALCVLTASEGVSESRLLLKPGDSLPSARASAVVAGFERLSSNRLGELFVTADANASSGTFGGVWRTDVRTGQTILVVEDGALVPGIDGAIFDEPFAEDISTETGPDGGLGLILTYAIPESDVSGFGTWYWDSSTKLTQLLLHNEPAPRFVDRLVFDPEVGGVNGTAGLANVYADTVPSGDVEPKHDATWFRDTAGDFHLVAVTGRAAPGLPDLVLDGEPRVDWINNAGQYLLDASVNAADGTPLESQRAIWLAGEGLGGPPLHILTEGDELPVDGSSVPASSNINIRSLNNNGELLLSANYPNGDDTLTGVWTYATGSGFRHLVSEGDPLPGLAPFRFEQVSAVDLSDAGEVLIQNNHPDFHAHYGAGLWLSSADGSLEPVILAGQTAPETETVFSDLGTAVRNAQGQVALEGKLENETPFDPRDDHGGIWAQNTSGEFRLVVRDGSVLDIGGESFQPITDPSLIGIDDRGYIVFSAAINDGAGRAVFVSDAVAVPEPSPTMHFLAAFLAFATRCTRRRVGNSALTHLRC